MKIRRFDVLLLALFGAAMSLPAQQKLTLDQAIARARMKSVDAAVARNELKTAYWEYRTFRADLLPEIHFSGSLPDYNKSYNAYQQEDGSYTFVRNNTLGLSGEIAVNQNLWFTGGRLSLNSSLNYLGELGNAGRHSFMSIPVALTLEQPLWGVNSLKWRRRIEPVRYAEAKAAFVSATENVTLTTVTLYFEFLLAQETVGISRQNLENAEKLFLLAQARRMMGQISQNELLQLKLSALNAKANLTDASSNLKAKMFQLRSFLDLPEEETIEPEIPVAFAGLQMDYHRVLDWALLHHSFVRNIRRRQLEADYQVAVARGDLRKIDLFASIGLSGQDRNVASTYNLRLLKNNQIVRVGVTIPILDWGKRRGKVKVAQSNREVVASKIRQEQMTFNQDIFLLVEQYNNQGAQLEIAAEADSIARQRYQTSVETFLAGRINTLDLSDARLSKDEARQKHISELYLYYYYYYQLRSITLWDFPENGPIDADFEAIIKG